MGLICPVSCGASCELSSRAKMLGVPTRTAQPTHVRDAELVNPSVVELALAPPPPQSPAPNSWKPVRDEPFDE